MRFSLKYLLLLVTVIAIGFAISPTILRWYDWESRRAKLQQFSQTDYLTYGYADVMEAAKPIFNNLIDELCAQSFLATAEDKDPLLKKCTKDLVAMMDRGLYLETVEYEQLAVTTFEICEIAGIDLDEGKYKEWRDE